MSLVQRAATRISNLKLINGRNIRVFSYNGHINENINGFNGSELHWQERVRKMECISLRKVDIRGAKELFHSSKKHLPKDIDIVSNDTNKDELILKLNKLNKESSITLKLFEHFDINLNESQTHISEISRNFECIHEPIAVAVQGTLNKYVQTLQKRINKGI